MVYSLLWVMQDFVHQPKEAPTTKLLISRPPGFRVSGLGFNALNPKPLKPLRASSRAAAGAMSSQGAGDTPCDFPSAL